jgi:hypothetical protein
MKRLLGHSSDARPCHKSVGLSKEILHLRPGNGDKRLKIRLLFQHVEVAGSEIGQAAAAVRQLAGTALRRHNRDLTAIRGHGVASRLTDEEESALHAELIRLRQDHRDLDAAISALEEVGTPDRLQLQRLKKRKLGLRDRIVFLEDQLTPDIIA